MNRTRVCLALVVFFCGMLLFSEKHQSTCTPVLVYVHEELWSQS